MIPKPGDILEQHKRKELKFYDGEKLSQEQIEKNVDIWMEKGKEEMENINFDVFSYYISKHVNLAKNYLCLDAGCGPGHVSYTLEKNTSFVMVGMDLSSTVLAAASKLKRHNGFKTELVRGDLENAAFKNDVFDLVIIVNTIHHFPDFDAPLASVKRVLKPGGRLIIWDSNLLFPTIFLATIKLKLKRQLWGSENEWPFTKFHLRKSLKRMGFREIYLRNIRYLPLAFVREKMHLDDLLNKVPVINLFGNEILCIAEK